MNGSPVGHRRLRRRIGRGRLRAGLYRAVRAPVLLDPARRDPAPLRVPWI